MPRELLQLAVADTGADRLKWVYALSLGETWVRNTDSGNRVMLTVTEDVVLAVADQTRKVMDSFRRQARLTSSAPVQLPVWALHDEKLGEFGHLIDVRAELEGEKRGVWLKVRFNDRYEPGAFSHVSVGLTGEYTVQDGTTYGPVIAELSLCSTPKDQRIGSLDEALTAQLSNLIARHEEKMTIEELTAALTDALAPIANEQAIQSKALSMLLEQLEDSSDEDEDSSDEDEDSSDEDEDGSDEDEDSSDEDETPESIAAANSAVVIELAQLREQFADLKSQNAMLARAVLGKEKGKPGRVPKAKGKTPAERQEALRNDGVRGVDNVLKALGD